MKCPTFKVPDCAENYYRPASGKINEKGFVNCLFCDNTKCPTFKEPDCAEKFYRPSTGRINEKGYIDCLPCDNV